MDYLKALSMLNPNRDRMFEGNVADTTDYTALGIPSLSNSGSGGASALFGQNYGNLGSGTFGIGDNSSALLSNAAGGGGSWMDAFKGLNLFGSTDENSGIRTDGLLGSGLGIMKGLGSAYMGMKQYGLAKDQLNLAKKAYNNNYAAQKKSTNAILEDRQRARVASNSGAYESVDGYMQKNGIA